MNFSGGSTAKSHQYSNYFSVDQHYFPQINQSTIKRDPESWLRTYPHETFVEMLRQMERILARQERRSLWIEGAYGTGKSQCAYALKKILEVPEEELRNKLYYDPNFDVSYDDILSLLNRCGDQFCSRNKVICLGNHPGKSDSQDPEGAMKDALLASFAVNMQTEISRGIGPGEQISSLSPEAKRVNPHRKFLNVLHATLIKAGLYKNTSLPIFKAMPSPTPVETPIPQWKDRTFFTRKCLYPVQPILYHGLRNEHKRSAQFGQKVHLYLDVSYSMCDNLPWIVSALAPLEQAGWCRIFLFSTRVFPAPKEGIAQEELKTTGGTDISCVLQHIVEWEPRTRPAKIIILTDGYFRVPIGTLMDQFKNTKVKIFGAITRNGSKCAMEAIAVYTVLMPEYR
ncbi:MAG TPA: hypothetical protein PK491_11210 [Candidatus Hydrogenedentes bacterium]|nr:hypothetical protein [Candidatus Hydrogenedentota bacterium]